MRVFRYILALAVAVATTSCTLTDIDTTVNGTDSRNSVQIVGRIVSFSECDVDTRAEGKNVDESSTQSMCLAVFDSNNECKEAPRYSKGNNITFTLERTKLNNGDKLYIFANIADPTGSADIGVGKPLDNFLKIVAPVNNITTFPTLTLDIDGTEQTVKCLPMIGCYEIVDKDNMPALIPIPLEALYAKMVFTISVTPEQKVDGIDPASFTFEKYEVYNVPIGVDFAGAGETNDDGDDNILTTPYSGKLAVGENDFAQGSDEIKFSFYLPERFLKPTVAAENYKYPFGFIKDLDEDEARRYPQRYKPELVKDRKATYVKIYGEFIDHQSHNFKVEYHVYVGKDNYGNFDVERNKQYNNSLTIKGISASKDGSTNTDAISIDYRVNVTRVEPIIVNLRRETLLDSHFEVRPLRIRKNPTYTGKETNTSVMVEVIYKDQADAKWVGIERSFGNGEVQTTIGGAYLVASELGTNRTNAAGKRRYFTSNLTESLQSPVTIPITDDGETVWIYVDEALSANAKDGVRSATIKVSYLVNEVPYGDPIYYTISQRELFPVTYGSNKYLIEYHEEYLHNYDADDSYGQTDYEGMQWGLDGEKISEINKNHKAYVTEPGGDDGVSSAIYNSVVTKANAYYDFYMPRDIDKSKWYIEGDFTLHERAGHDFTNEIVQAQSIAQCNLAEVPTSAVQYCLSKNKKGENNWYLPAIDEIEEIVMSTYGEDQDQYSYSRFPDFQAKFYWSSQPAYTRNYFDGQRTLGDRWGIYQQDNLYYARATKVKYENTTGGGASDPDNYHNEGSGIPMGGHPWGSGNGTVTSNIYCHQYISGNISGTQWTGYSYNGTIDEVPDSGKTIEGSNYYGTSALSGSHKWKHTLIRPEPYYEPGYKRRTDYARVRCVRKQ